MKTQFPATLCSAMLVLLILQTSSLYGQATYSPSWIFNISSRFKVESDDKEPFQSPYIEDFRFYSGILRSLSPHTFLGVEVNTQLERGYQFAHLGTTFRYYPLSSERTFAPFAELSPGMGWNRNRYLPRGGCTGACTFSVSNRWFFYPLITSGITWRPRLGKVALEVKAIYWPQYYAGPFFEDMGEKISLRASFSFWINRTNN